MALFEYGQVQSGTGEPKRFASEDLSHRLPSGEAIDCKRIAALEGYPCAFGGVVVSPGVEEVLIYRLEPQNHLLPYMSGNSIKSTRVEPRLTIALTPNQNIRVRVEVN